MKVYVATRFLGEKNKLQVEQLCSAVANAGMIDFSFVRDIEQYQKTFDSPVDLWERARTELQQCDALLVDVSDSPTGGRVIEAGMAYALKMPIIVVVKNGVKYKELYDGIATAVITYQEHKDITKQLAAVRI